MKCRHAFRTFAQKTKQRTAVSSPGAIGVPCVDWMWTDTVQALMTLRYPPGTCVALETGTSTIASKRNSLVRMLLEKPELQWMLFLDSDMTPPRDIIPKLLETHRDIVSALCVTRKPPYRPCVGFVDPDDGLRTTPLSEYGGPDPVKEVEWVGAGCVLIRRRVFESMEPLWFEATPEDQGEDSAFCLKARAAGFKIFCDTSQWVGHIGANAVTIEDTIKENTSHPQSDGLRASCRQPVKAPLLGADVRIEQIAQ